MPSGASDGFCKTNVDCPKQVPVQTMQHEMMIEILFTLMPPPWACLSLGGTRGMQPAPNTL
jgi:hypothetical protein